MRPLYKPFKSTAKNKKMSVFVINEETKKRKLIHFGDSRYKHNYSKEARESYDKRSKAIRGKKGLTYNNKNTANYWARKVLWKL